MKARVADLRYGTWQGVLSDVRHVDHLITDPPFSERTHKGQKAPRRDASKATTFVSSTGLPYDFMTPAHVDAFVDAWSARVRGWMCVFTSHDLVPAYEAAFARNERYSFAPLSCQIPGMNVRLVGDGPANWTVWLVVARPIGMPLWGALPGGYRAARERPPKGTGRVPGQKPFELMRQVVRDYSRPGDVVCDPFAGSGTTLLAALRENRKAIGAESNRVHYDLARSRLTAPAAAAVEATA